MSGAGAVDILEHIVVTVSKFGGGGITITNIWLLEEGRSRTRNLTQSLIGLVEPSPNEVGSIWSGVRSRGRRGKGLRRDGRIFEGKEGKGRKMREGVRNTHGTRGGHVNVVATIVGNSRTNIESTGGVCGPSEAFQR